MALLEVGLTSASGFVSALFSVELVVSAARFPTVPPSLFEIVLPVHRVAGGEERVEILVRFAG